MIRKHVLFFAIAILTCLATTEIFARDADFVWQEEQDTTQAPKDCFYATPRLTISKA